MPRGVSVDGVRLIFMGIGREGREDVDLGVIVGVGFRGVQLLIGFVGDYVRL